MSNNNNIYNILNSFNKVAQEPKPVITEQSVERKKTKLEESMEQISEKYMGFKKVAAAAKEGGAKDPAAVAAAIGRKKYGKEKFQQAAAAGKKLGEASKPDYIDLDKDGNKTEPMKKAAKDAKAKKVEEVAPPGAKAERMVKHIKAGYAKDGKLTPKEKSIAYATAWKSHNKGKVEETIKSLIDAGFTKEQIVEGWEEMMKSVAQKGKEEKGTGKFDKKKISTGTVYTRKYDPKTGETDDSENVTAVKRGRGRPRKNAFENYSIIDKMIAEVFGEGRIEKGVWVDKPGNVPVPMDPEGVPSKPVSTKPAAAATKPQADMGSAAKDLMAPLKYDPKAKVLPSDPEGVKEEELSEIAPLAAAAVPAAATAARAAAPWLAKGLANVGKQFAAGLKGLPARTPSGTFATKASAPGLANTAGQAVAKNPMTTATTAAGLGYAAGAANSPEASAPQAPAAQADAGRTTMPAANDPRRLDVAKPDAPKVSDTVASVAAASGIKNPNLIRPGQEINLPSGEKYVVQKGDTLSGIVSARANQPATQTATTAPADSQPSALATQAQTTTTAESEMDKSLEEMMKLAGLKTNEDEMEEGNAFTGALAKARAAGKKEADLDGDGDLEKVKPANESVESQLDECGGMGMVYGDRESEGKMNINTNMSSDGTKNVTVSADGEAAVELLQMLKLAGVGGAEPEVEAVEEEKDERYHASTTPDEEVMPVQQLTKGGNGDVAGQEKTMRKHGYQFGDNNLAMRDVANEGIENLDSMGRRLMKDYESIKVKK